MGKIFSPNPVKLIFSIISAENNLFYEAKDLLVSYFGNIDMESDFQLFDYTSYYRDEMGDRLKQKMISFEKLILPDQLSNIKINSNKWEFILSTRSDCSNEVLEKKRKVNLDPGYITLSKFVLASTKDGPARIYLKEGIYAEITLRFMNSSYHPLEWTYQNYKTELYLSFLNKVRERYKKEIRGYHNKNYIKQKMEKHY
jgi:hypothetical protein